MHENFDHPEPGPGEATHSHEGTVLADLDKKEFNLPIIPSPSISPDPPKNPPPLLKKMLPK